MPKRAIIDIPWPKNLISALYFDRMKEAVDEESVAKATEGRDDCELGIIMLHMISTLKEGNFKPVILKRYYEHRTLADIAKEMERTPERIREIESKALRMLRHPSRISYLTDGVAIMHKSTYESSREETEKMKSEYEAEITRLNTIIETNQIPAETKPAPMAVNKSQIYLRSINDMDLSVRLYNILARANIYTVADAVKCFKEDRVRNLRNMGRVTHDELVAKLIDAGISYEELDIDQDLIMLRKAEAEARAEANRLERERKQKAEAEAKAIRLAKEKEAIKYFPEIRDKIINDGVDALKLLFEPPIIDLLQRHLEKFQLNERCVAILMMTEIVDPESDLSPIKEMIDRDGLEKFNKTAFSRMIGYSRHVSWERYQYRGNYPPPGPKDKNPAVEKLKYVFVREMNLKGEIKSVLYNVGMLTAYDLYLVFPDRLPALLNEALEVEYYKDLLSTVNIYDVNSIMAEIATALKTLGV